VQVPGPVTPHSSATVVDVHSHAHGILDYETTPWKHISNHDGIDTRRKLSAREISDYTLTV
jgi:hypothetical protein